MLRSRAEQSQTGDWRPESRCPDSQRAPPDDLKLNVQHMNYVSCLIKWFHLHARAPHACAAGSQAGQSGSPLSADGPAAGAGPNNLLTAAMPARSARWLSLNKNGYCVGLSWPELARLLLVHPKRRRRRARAGSGYLCVAFVRIINVNLS